MTSYKGKNIATVDECKFILRILLKEISECDHCRQKHIEGLRHAIMTEEVAATANEILEHEAREELLK
jgi:hypothetical protein